jgi:hypothetical protein
MAAMAMVMDAYKVSIAPLLFFWEISNRPTEKVLTRHTVNGVA